MKQKVKNFAIVCLNELVSKADLWQFSAGVIVGAGTGTQVVAVGYDGHLCRRWHREVTALASQIRILERMGTRREPRILVRLPVRIFGTDANGRRFSEDVHTADISRYGARLKGVLAQLRVGEVVGLSHGESKGRFVVQWAGEPGTDRAGQVGLFNSAPEKWTWETPLPPAYIDNYSGAARANQERRKYPRYKSMNSVQIQEQGQAAPIWGKTVDLSEGGCFIDMQIPLDVGVRVKLTLWVKERKLFATGKVISRRPGFGNGVQFTEMSALDSQRLTEFLQTLAQARR